jgi:hypothetical protein
MAFGVEGGLKFVTGPASSHLYQALHETKGGKITGCLQLWTVPCRSKNEWKSWYHLSYVPGPG